jgi:hypothetical protein
MDKKISFVIKLQKPVCRTPIKPIQKHKSVADFSRKSKHKANLTHFFNEERSNDGNF